MNIQSSFSELLAFNREFVACGSSLSFKAEKRPRKGLALVTCMDTRLTTLLAAALGFDNGDVILIKTAGGEVNEFYGATMRSLLVAVYELGVTDVMVIGHTDCGVQYLDASHMRAQMKQAGIGDEAFATIETAGVDFNTWLKGFGDIENSVRNSVSTVRGHPLMPNYVQVGGFIIDINTAELVSVAL